MNLGSVGFPFNNFEDLCEKSFDFESFHNQNHRYSVNNNRTPLNVHKMNQSISYLEKDNQIPEYIPIESGEIILIRFVRSNRKLNIFGETFLTIPDLTYNYVEAMISIEGQMLKIYSDIGILLKRI